MKTPIEEAVLDYEALMWTLRRASLHGLAEGCSIIATAAYNAGLGAAAEEVMDYKGEFGRHLRRCVCDAILTRKL